MTRAGVFGTGSWGTAFALVLADAGTDVVMWGRRAELCEAVNRTRRNPDYLPDVELPPPPPPRLPKEPSWSSWPCRRRRCGRT